MQLGSYMGFPIHLYVDRAEMLNLLQDMKEYRMNMRRELTHPVEYSSDPVGLIRRIENPMAKMENHFKTFKKQIAGYTERRRTRLWMIARVKKKRPLFSMTWKTKTKRKWSIDCFSRLNLWPRRAISCSSVT